MSSIQERIASSQYLSFTSAKAADELAKRYAARKRKYHTWDHVEELLALLPQVEDYLECLPCVALAAAWHDSIMDFRANDNEVRSAALMRKFTRGLDLFWIERADTLIQATAKHQLPHDWPPESDAGYFLDMDLAVLGSAPQRYQRYAADVREEYAHLAPSLWQAGRTRVLQNMLTRCKRGELYNTAWGQRQFAAAAQANMLGELQQLTMQPQEN